MKRIDAATIEWRALSETMVIPVPRRARFSRASMRQAIQERYPFKLGGCGVHHLAVIGAVLIIPPWLSGTATSRPVPALAIGGSFRVRRSLAAGEALYRFGTSRGYDYYQFRHRRLVTCWSTVTGESQPEPTCAASLQFPRRVLTSRHGSGKARGAQRALVATVAAASMAVVLQALPEGRPLVADSGSATCATPGDEASSPTVNGGADAPREPSPFQVLTTANHLIPHLHIRAFSETQDHYRWHLHTPEPFFAAAALTDIYPEIDVSLTRRNGNTTILLEGRK